MEVYILDSLLRRDTVIDVFESLIWTERVAAWGDFQLLLRSTPAARKLFATGTMLAVNESYRVMEVETVENNTDSEGRNMLTIKGRSIEKILEDRVAKKTLSNLTTEPSWILTGIAQQVMRDMFDHVVRNGSLNIGDQIPFLQTGTIFPTDTLAGPVDPIRWEQSPDTLYNALKDIAERYTVGFRLIRNFDTSQLYFDVYTGRDRTTGQTEHAPVIFSPSLDNLQNTTEFTTIEKAKNVAYVFSDQGFQVVYPQDVPPDIDGFDRRVLNVKAENLEGTPSADDIAAHLAQKGREALNQSRSYSAFDGEIDQNSQYKYGTHYQLGDIVEMRGTEGTANNMRVTEQIFVSDREGERSYPTLTLYQYVTTGSWFSWMSDKVWLDLDNNPTTWAEQP